MTQVGPPATRRVSAPASPHPTFPSLAVAHAPSVRGHLLRWASRLKKEISLEVDYRETWSHGWLLMRPAAQRRTIRRLQTMGVAAAAARADDAAAGTAPAALSYRLSLLSSIAPLSPLLRASSSTSSAAPRTMPTASRQPSPATGPTEAAETAAAKQAAAARLPSPPVSPLARAAEAICGGAAAEERAPLRPLPAATQQLPPSLRLLKHTAKGLGVGDADDDAETASVVSSAWTSAPSSAWSGYLGSVVDDIESELRWWSALVTRP